jgi:hypothetical protein
MMSQVEDLQKAETDREQWGRQEQSPGEATAAAAAVGLG